uniref:Ligand-gated ion channel n=1 Tax=Globodera pallida TaxID=36090 RepID=A0A183CNK7_GLOPA
MLLYLFLIRFGIEAVTLSAGSHLDMSVIVTVQKNYTGDSCQTSMASWAKGEKGKDTDKECLWRKCAQQVQYKVDLGYSKVRMSVDGMPYQYPRGLNRESFVREKNRVSRMLAERVRRLNNDAFQPYLYYEFEKLIRHFYDGHSRILALFNLSMGELVEERLSVSNYTLQRVSELECAKILKLIALLERNWQFDWGRHNDDVTDITFFEAIKYRIPPSPIPMIEAYQQEAITKQKLVDHINQLFRLLLEFWRDLSQNSTARQDANCRKLIAETEHIIKNEPLVARVAYSSVRSVLVRNLEVILRSKISFCDFRAARGQGGKYFENNMATLRFRFLSMTVVQMEESREYNNFNLLVDLGSTMGLYFGLTLLTVFELIIFLFHNRASANPTPKPNENPKSGPNSLHSSTTNHRCKRF